MKLHKANKDLSYYIQLNTKNNPHKIFISTDSYKINFLEVHQKIISIHYFLKKKGIKKKDRIVGYFSNSIEQIIAMLAVTTYGAIWIPLSSDREISYLNFILKETKPKLILIEEIFYKLFKKNNLKNTIIVKKKLINFEQNKSLTILLPKNNLYKTCCIIFTSGTSGPPKGVMVTQKMLLLSAIGNAISSKYTKKDRYLLWESLHHIAGIQLFVMGLIYPTKIYLISKFSRKSFWKTVKKFKITILHYLGGLLEILLKNKKSKVEQSHSIKIAYGAGCRPLIYRAFKKRFKIPIREVYGMTEASSFSTINKINTQGIIGKPVPWLNIELLDQNKKIIKKPECVGEIVIKEKVKGALFNGYYGKKRNNKNNFFLTGDLAKYNSKFELIYAGRAKDTIRVKGINISAWEIEGIVNSHKFVSESAALAIPALVGEDDILVIIIRKKKSRKSLFSYANCYRTKFSKLSFPRYWAFIDQFPRTPTQRIDKKLIEIKKLQVMDYNKKKLLKLS